MRLANVRHDLLISVAVTRSCEIYRSSRGNTRVRRLGPDKRPGQFREFRFVEDTKDPSYFRAGARAFKGARRRCDGRAPPPEWRNQKKTQRFLNFSRELSGNVITCFELKIKQ